MLVLVLGVLLMRWPFQRLFVASFALSLDFCSLWCALVQNCVCVAVGLSCGAPWCQMSNKSSQFNGSFQLLTFQFGYEKKKGSRRQCDGILLAGSPVVNQCSRLFDHVPMFRSWGYTFVGAPIFDSTLGFPGEGPVDTHHWTLTTANIGSLKQNKYWKTWNSDIACLQETRVGKNNLRDSCFAAKAVGLTLFPGALLPGLITSHGQQRITHGGTAIVGHEQSVTPFSSADDATGLYDSVLATKRANACWAQVLPRLKVLVFSVYARTGATQDTSVHQFNDSLFSNIFEISSQFGDIPIIIAGDLQADPLSYESISQALLFNKWVDPLQSVDSEGHCTRPLTFSNDGTFTGVGEHCSSIDAVLLNSVAAASLQNIWIDELFNIQHRPIHVSFEWRRACQHGFVLQKFAAFDLSRVPTRSNKVAFSQFEQDVQSRLATLDFQDKLNPLSSDQQWDCANQFCISSLLEAGAFWAEGPRQRACAPVFKTKQHCPGQHHTGCATSLKLSWLYNALGSVHELQIRFARPTTRGPDAWVTFRTIHKLRSRLEKLTSPVLWRPFELPSLVQLDQCANWLTQTIHGTEHALKIARIQNWKQKIAQSVTGHKSYIYKHLRNKNIDEPANLVTDQDGNILFQPDQAIHAINDRWDDVFAANAGFPHPLKMLEVVWPYIQTKTHSVEVPQITAFDLQQVVLKRNPLSAPGLDGWRTQELQALPVSCFEPFAMFFRQLEVNDVALPSSLVCARQMILNKNGSSCPMQKRIITVLPIILLAYTGCRFRHLKVWQTEAMPPALQGGIPQRRMDAVHTHMKLSIDQAIVDKQPILGLKLDKIIPSYAAALMLTYGIPKNVVSFFLKIYNGLHRHLSYKSWISPVATTTANGVAQGCSLSLIAINVYMKTWCHLLEFLPQITVKAFVDDSYLWTHLSNARILSQAVAVTRMWDELSGQKFNDDKSTSWGTSNAARKKAKQLFPSMKIAKTFDVLGTWIRTANVPCKALDEAKVCKIVTDAKNISVLPVPMSAKSLLVGAKVVPQCTYGAAINQIPRAVSSKLQSAIATAFWFRRPHWRNKMLLFGLLHKPHRVEPQHASAYCAIMDFHRFVCAFPDFFDKCNFLLGKIAENGFNYMRTVVEAFNLFGLRLDDGLVISFRNSSRIPLIDCHAKDLRKTLQCLARNACYHAAAHKTRKDMHKPTGVLDFDLTATFWRYSKLSFDSTIPASAFFEAQLVGCQLTRDRLFAAGCVDDPCCRFCGCDKESLDHLVHDCPYVQQKFGSHPSHEFGPNFDQLGIFEHPASIIVHRLQWSDPAAIVVNQLRDTTALTQLWTDGSIFWADVHWLTAGGFSVVDQSLQVCRRGPVFHWSLSSYATELWAILEACSYAETRVIIGSDCLTVVGQCWTVMDSHSIPSTWSHQSWWKFFLHLWLHKFHANIEELEIFWTPAHLYENIPIPLITDEMADLKGTTRLSIECNRKADFVAKEAALDSCAIHPDTKPIVLRAILGRQEFLTKLSFELGLDVEIPLQPEKFETRDEVDIQDEHAVISYFQGWNWNDTLSSFKTRIKLTPTAVAPSKWGYTCGDWATFRSFVRGLRWQIRDDFTISFAELACLFVLRGHMWEAYSRDESLFSDLIPSIKKAFFWAKHHDGFNDFPGHTDSHKAKKIGKCMPHGVIDGANAFISKDEKLAMGRLFFLGVSTPLRTWSFPLAELCA